MFINLTKQQAIALLADTVVFDLFTVSERCTIIEVATND